MTFYEAALRILESEGRPCISLKSPRSPSRRTCCPTSARRLKSRCCRGWPRWRGARGIARSSSRRRHVRARRLGAPGGCRGTCTDRRTRAESRRRASAAASHGAPPRAAQRPCARGGPRQRAQAPPRGEEGERAGRKRRFPPLPEVVFEILSEAEGPLPTAELIDRARARSWRPRTSPWRPSSPRCWRTTSAASTPAAARSSPSRRRAAR